MANQYIYLHGFASSPNSAKAQFISDRFCHLALSLSIPNLNQDDFSHLTLTRQIAQVSHLFPQKDPVTLLGSSLGGLTSAWVAQKYPQVERLVLLAPAFGFLTQWLGRLGTDTIREWKNSEFLQVYHYGEKRSLPLHYQFVQDVEEYDERQLQRPIPTLIVHGKNDEVIPVANSREYARNRPWVKLVEVDSDHALADVMPEIWSSIREFCKL